MSIKGGLEKATLYSAKGLALTQTGVDRVLWGSRAMVYKVQEGASGSYTTQAQESGRQTQNNSRSFNPLDYGVLPILQLVSTVDLCNIVNYLLLKTRGRKPPKRKENPTAIEKNFYNLQDRAKEVQDYIDQFTSSPNKIIGRYTGLGSEAASEQQIAQQRQQNAVAEQRAGAVGGAATVAQQAENELSGTNTQKYNLANLVLYIKATFSGGTLNEDGKSIFTPEEQQLLTAVPGLSNALNAFNDYLNKLDQYADYRNISDANFQRALSDIDKARSICVLIQNLDIQDPLGLATLLLPPGTVEEQVNRIQKWLNPAQLIPTLQKVNTSLQSFIRLVRKGQQTLAQGQFIIKIALLLIKILRFIVKFLKKLPLPSIFATVGIHVSISNICEKITKFLDDLRECVEQVNSLLNVFLAFCRYLALNTDEISKKLVPIIDNLKNCETQKDSPVVKQLEDTTGAVSNLQEQLTNFITSYDTKAATRKSTAGRYTIRIIDEELVDEGIPNKRRRGVALDLNGILVAQSDLTFASDDNIIIEEVRRKLKSLGLIEPGITDIDIDVSFLLDDDVDQSDLTLDEEDAEDPDNEDEEKGLGLQAFVNKLKGGRRLRRRTRRRLARAKRQLQQQIGPEGQKASKTLGIGAVGSNATPSGNLQRYKVLVYKIFPLPVGNPITQLSTRQPTQIVEVLVDAVSLADAVKAAKEKVDEEGKYPKWKYVPSLIK